MSATTLHITGTEKSTDSPTVVRATCACGWVGPWQGTLAYPWKPEQDAIGHQRNHATDQEA